MEAFEPSFGDPHHFTQLHAGFFVGRYDIGLHDNHHVGLKANIRDRSSRTALGSEDRRPITAAEPVDDVIVDRKSSILD